MRSVESVKKQRDLLREELMLYIDIKNTKYLEPNKHRELSEYEKKELSYVINCLDSLRCQINALEFVLNEDTALFDCTIPNMRQKEYGINKEEILKYE